MATQSPTLLTTPRAPHATVAPHAIVAFHATHALRPTHPPHAIPSLQPFGLRSPAQNPANNPAGSWKLATGHAVTLHDDRGAVLRITHGSVWATVDGPHAGPANNQGDLFLKSGDRLTLQPGQRVVIEPHTAHSSARSSASANAGGSAGANAKSSANEAVYFSWDPALAAAPLHMHAALHDASRFQLAVVCPLRDLGLALKLAGQALGRGVWGVAGLSEFLVAGRGRVQPCLESNPP